MADTILDVVDENDNVIGQALRSEIHAKGLLHREANVLFVTPQKEIVLQKRSMTKQNNPGLLSVTVGGHVDCGETYLDAAIRETFEETGVTVRPEELIFLGQKKYMTHDKITGTHNNAIRAFYGLVYFNDLKDLKIEIDAIDGFEKVALDGIFNLPEQEKKRFAASLVNPEMYGDIFQALGNLVK